MFINDAATLDFMKVASSDVDKHQQDHKNEVAKQSLSFAKGLATGGVKALPINVLKRTIAIAMHEHSHDHNQDKQASSTDMSAIPMWHSLNERYGKSWWDWEPETIWQTLTNDFMGHPNDELKNLIQALQVICRTNFPFEDWSTFEKVGHALNSNHVTFDHVQLMELDQIAYTIEVLNTLRKGVAWSDDVLAYVAASAKHCGVVYLPKDLFPLGCNEFLDKMGNHNELADEVEKALSSARKQQDVDTPLGMQQARIQEIRDYIKARI